MLFKHETIFADGYLFIYLFIYFAIVAIVLGRKMQEVKE